MAFSLLVGSLAVVAVAPSAEAARGTYSPDVEETDDVVVVETEVLGSNEQVSDPPAADPGAEISGSNNPAPLVAPQVSPVSDPAPAPASDVAPEKAGVTLPRTGTTILPLVRAGTAILALGLGLVVLARRRRTAIA